MASSSDKSPSNAGQSEGAGGINWNWSGDDMKVDQSLTAKPQELKASRAYSVATPAADKSRRAPLKANNPGSIPTAGGRALGQGAREERERRKSRMSSDDMEMPPLDKEGSPDATTQNNTQSNTIPQRMNENGEGSSKVEDRPVSSPAPDVTVTGADSKDDAVITPPAAAPAETPAQDTVSDLPAAKENSSPPPASKERRGSRLDDVLGKLKLGGSKKK